MNLVSKAELKELIKENKSPCVSIYQPTHRAGQETQQDPIRLKNLLSRAEQELVAQNQRSAEARKLLQPARDLLADSGFWQEQADGLAMFLAPGMFRYYRLPIAFQEELLVGNHFYLKPMIPMLTGNGQFYVLAVSKKQARLLQCNRDSFREVPVPGMPAGLAETLKYDVFEKQLQVHSSGPGRQGEQAGIYHGQGGASEMSTHKKEIARYFKEVDKALHRVLKNSHFPLVFAGVEYLYPIYEQANTYPHLIKDEIAGNPDQLCLADLHRRAWTILQPHFARGRQRDQQRFEAAWGTGLASCDIAEVLPAAFQGRVDVLFVDPSSRQWGTYVPASGQVQIHHKDPRSHSEDLLDLATVHTLIHDGMLYTKDAHSGPGDGPLAAIFRY